ncbi:natterin-3-like [Tautogolabrus adspersus]
METESILQMCGGREFQRRGAERLKALGPMVDRREGGAMKMKLSVLLLLALSALSSSSPRDIRSNTERRNAAFDTVDHNTLVARLSQLAGIRDPNGSPKVTVNSSVEMDPPLVTVTKIRQKREVQSSAVMSDGGSILEWVTWNNSLPNDAVSIYNDYVGRTDYVCKYKCHAGFYTPTSNRPYCYYANAKKEHTGFPFEILVKKNNFEILEWKDGSRGSVPKNSVRTCPGENIYVGKNQYGLGKVDTLNKLFYLPWKDTERTFNDYQVLTINENIVSQQIDNVKYITDESKIIHFPPETMHKTTLSNYECHPVVKTDTLSKTYQVTQRWDISSSTRVGGGTSFSIGIPVITSTGIQVSAEEVFQYSKGNTMTDTITDTVSMDITAPPNHSCTINMMRYKYKLTIPFTARLSRTYGNGEIHTTTITGTYSSVQVGEVRAVVDRCKLLSDSKKCD